MRLAIFFSLILIFNFSCASYAIGENIAYDLNQEGLMLKFGDDKSLKLALQAEAGLVRDGALYGSFGLENQIFKFSKIVFQLDGKYQESQNSNWFFKLDVAPVYDYINVVPKPNKIYGQDSQGHDIDGNNVYFDWYKNLGSRIYYLGSIPIIEAYIGYQFGSHSIKLGRMKTMIGFDDQEMFWTDDGKFAPMSYWLSRDLFSGVTYQYSQEFLSVIGGVFSGGNPTKGYSNYLDHVESANIKSNNTPTLAGKIQLNYDNLLPSQYRGYLYGSYMHNMTGSTWANELSDGKRNASVAAHGIMFKIKPLGWWLVDKIKIFAQYTQYLSGLTTKSSQSAPANRLRNIKQSGYFLGTEVLLLGKKLSLGAAYERFSRFDYNIFAHNNFQQDTALENKKQHSYIFQVKYFPKPFFALGFAYHAIKNPCKYQSNILDKKKDNRFKVTAYLDF